MIKRLLSLFRKNSTNFVDYYNSLYDDDLKSEFRDYQMTKDQLKYVIRNYVSELDTPQREAMRRLLPHILDMETTSSFEKSSKKYDRYMLSELKKFELIWYSLSNDQRRSQVSTKISSKEQLESAIQKDSDV